MPFKILHNLCSGTYDYDNLGRSVSVAQPLKNGGKRLIKQRYSGFSTTEIRADNTTTVTTKNFLDQTVSIKEGGQTISYRYDALGNLTKTNTNGSVITVSYDSTGKNKTKMVDPGMGTWTYAYNGFNELIRQTDNKKQVTVMTYDKLGRMTSRTDQDKTTWVFDKTWKGSHYGAKYFPTASQNDKFGRAAVSAMFGGLAAEASGGSFDDGAMTALFVYLFNDAMARKRAYHLPVHRQHQRLKDAGITVSRSSLLNWCGRAIELLEPIVHAQYQSILTSRVLGMDETPVKAGKAKTKGKMKQGYLWPMYGDQDEVVFHFNPSRGSKVIQEQLGKQFDGVLLCDGYVAYKTYAENKGNVTLANCWSHSRRTVEAVKTIDPLACEEALQLIGALYHNEAHIRDHELEGQTKLDYRTQYSEPIVKQFWQWCEEQQQRQDLFPKHPLQKALNYVLERIEPLQVFLSDPDVPLDTNHVERALRGIPLGRKNWMFCWTEMGARQVGIIQSLIVTCRLHGVNPYQYLVDVLQRIAIHPAKQVEELTPRRWKTQFADNPMLSDVNRER